jgi:hypothetical protein
MLTKNLYKKILISPVTKNVNKLFILSGYSSGTFARKHLIDIIKINPNCEVKLIIGMGLKDTEHLTYLNLLKNFKKNLSIFYYTSRPLNHSKLYIWLEDDIPLIGFSGSSNYTQYGFFETKQINQMTQDDPQQLLYFFNDSLKKSSEITDNKFIVEVKSLFMNEVQQQLFIPGQIEWIKENEIVKISLLDKKGIVPKKSGLNWGQRPGREPNQAYLSIKSDARKEGFLPEKKFTFTLLTDDGIPLNCTVQQQGRKSITTTDNSILGKYIRKRIDVPEGSKIEVEDLIKYGRTDFILKKIDDETFLFDFSIG